ncbi:restriction endonuclease subunit S [candidate division WOR-3 bacterium]|nr:restriction endonuclease subunit S [candidate division WOR-3 bacterium]
MEQVNSLKTGKKFKKTEIGEIPVDWEVMQIHDLCTLGRGRVISQNEIDNNPGQYSVFSSQSKDKGVMGYINSYDFDGEYVTWTTDGAYAGTVFYRGGKFNCTNVCGTLKSRVEFIDMSYLCYALNRLTKRHVVLCGNPKLMNNVMAQIKVQIPPLAEQKKIAEILTTVNEAIEKSDEIIEKIKELKKGLMQELLTRGIGHKKFKRTKIGEIPEDWGVLALDDISEEIYRYPTYYNINYVKQGIPEVRGRLIKSNGTLETDLSKYRSISPETAAEFPRTCLREGDFVMSVRGTMGKVAIIPKFLDGANMTANLIRISPDRNKIFPLFFHQILIGDKFQKILNITSSSTTIKTIKAPELKRLKFAIPPLTEQKKIAGILSTVDEDIEREVDNKKELEIIKKGLMQVLLTGKKRVKV